MPAEPTSPASPSPSEGTPVRPDFEAAYAADPDPFGVATRWYERRKMQVLLASLGRERYDRAWDAACGTGHLAVELAARCGQVVASDAAPTAVRLTTDLVRSGGAGDRVDVRALTLPGTPEGTFDLVVLSEVVYYLPEAGRQATCRAALDVLAADGEVAAVHWRHHPHDAHLSGADVTDELDAALTAAGLQRTVRHEDTDFVAACWTRTATEEAPA